MSFIILPLLSFSFSRPAIGQRSELDTDSEAHSGMGGRRSAMGAGASSSGAGALSSPLASAAVPATAVGRTLSEQRDGGPTDRMSPTDGGDTKSATKSDGDKSGGDGSGGGGGGGDELASGAEKGSSLASDGAEVSLMSGRDGDNSSSLPGGVVSPMVEKVESMSRKSGGPVSQRTSANFSATGGQDSALAGGPPTSSPSGGPSGVPGNARASATHRSSAVLNEIIPLNYKPKVLFPPESAARYAIGADDGSYKICFSFGLHSGMAIEGPVGSDYKVDASYISPQVNVTCALEKHGSQVYQSPLVLSEVFYRMCSLRTKQCIRKVDVVQLWSKICGIYTFPLSSRAMGRAPTQSDLHMLEEYGGMLCMEVCCTYLGEGFTIFQKSSQRRL